MIKKIIRISESQIPERLRGSRSKILRKIASRDLSNLGDISTLLNPEVVEDIINGAGLE